MDAKIKVEIGAGISTVEVMSLVAGGVAALLVMAMNQRLEEIEDHRHDETLDRHSKDHALWMAEHTTAKEEKLRAERAGKKPIKRRSQTNSILKGLSDTANAFVKKLKEPEQPKPKGEDPFDRSGSSRKSQIGRFGASNDSSAPAAPARPTFGGGMTPSRPTNDSNTDSPFSGRLGFGGQKTEDRPQRPNPFKRSEEE